MPVSTLTWSGIPSGSGAPETTELEARLARPRELLARGVGPRTTIRASGTSARSSSALADRGDAEHGRALLERRLARPSPRRGRSAFAFTTAQSSAAPSASRRRPRFARSAARSIVISDRCGACG